MSKLLAILGCALLAMMVSRAGAEELLERANADFREGRFKEAASGYEALLQRDGPRAAVLQNLGSAYFRAGDDGRAILAFERALALKPRDPDLRANLKLARDQAAVFPATEPDRWQRFSQALSRRQWSWLALAGAVALPLAVLLGVSARRRGVATFATFAAVGSIGLVALPWVVLRQRAAEDRRAIVLENQAPLRLSPFASAGTRGSLDAGRTVLLGEEKAGFRWVSTEDGAAAGWMAAAQVEPVIPRPSGPSVPPPSPPGSAGS